MTKPSLYITMFIIACILTTSTSMSVVLTPDTNTEAEDQATWDTISPDDKSPTATEQLNCTIKELLPEDVVPIGKQGRLLIKSSPSNLTLTLIQPQIFDPDQDVCFKRSRLLNDQIFDSCKKWFLEKNEFDVDEDDGTVTSYGEVLEPGLYFLQDGQLEVCIDEDSDYEDDSNSTENGAYNGSMDNVSIYIGQVCGAISIIALTAHLVSFCLVPSMRNLPGYNLASLSVAFLLAYLFSLIGQIPEVLGFFCELCGILVQYFFLVAFFCMNTLAFDVWRTLKMATTKLAMSSHNAKRRQFIYYSIYSWGVPLVISTISVVLDNVPGTPPSIKPEFGKHNICWMTNNKAKMVFFMAPAFTLFIANALFFILSAFIIKTNTMEATSDEQRQTARHNFVLYFRLGIMMGVTWLFGVVSALVSNDIVWIVFDLMNSLQGLFVFLLFTCSKKVIDHYRDKMQLAATLKTPKTSTSDLSGRKISSTDVPVIKSINLLSSFSEPIKPSP